MTRNEILALKPGRKMDNVIFEVLFRGDERYKVEDFHTGSMKIPRYSTDILDAWKVREWVKEHIGGIEIMPVCDEEPEYCHIWNGKKKIGAYGQTAPEAICKAALLAMCGDKP